MAAIDDFKAHLKAGNLAEALAIALSEAAELKITTWVAESNEEDVEAALPGHRLRTRINLIEGDRENEIGDRFIGNGSYRELWQFHLDQVADGNKIIQENLKSLHKLFGLLINIHSQNNDDDLIDILPDPPINLPPGTSENLIDSGEETILEPPTPTPKPFNQEKPPQIEEDWNNPLPPVENFVPKIVTITPLEETISDSPISLVPPVEESTPETVTIAPTEQTVPELPLTPIQSSQEITSTEIEEDEDEDDSIMNFLESITVPPKEEGTIQEENNLQLEQPSSESTLVEETFNQNDLEPNTSRSETEEDWEDWDDEEIDSTSTTIILNLESLDLETDEEWNNWTDDEPLDLGEVGSSVENPSNPDHLPQENWDEFAVEELEPYPNQTANIDREWDNFNLDDLDPNLTSRTKNNSSDRLEEKIPIDDTDILNIEQDPLSRLADLDKKQPPPLDQNNL